MGGCHCLYKFFVKLHFLGPIKIFELVELIIYRLWFFHIINIDFVTMKLIVYGPWFFHDHECRFCDSSFVVWEL